MRKVWGKGLALLLGMTAAPLHAQAPDASPTSPDTTARIAELRALIQAKAQDRAASEEVAKAQTELAALLEARGDAPGALAVRKQTTQWFAQGKYPPGGLQAAAAAEAEWRITESDLVRGGRMAVPLDRLKEELPAWFELVLGPQWKSGKVAGGFVSALDKKFADYQVATWARAAAWTTARLLLQAVEQLPHLQALDPGQKDAMAPLAKTWSDQAFATLERAWRDAESRNQRDVWTAEIRKELHKLRPQMYPLMDEVKPEEEMTPAQREASRQASLALKATKPGLKVLYLRKAVQLEPNNERYRELLKAAEAEAAGQ